MAAFRVSRSFLTASPSRLVWQQTQQQQFSFPAISIRRFTPFSKEEELAEKQRVSTLTPMEKDQELRQLNRKITELETLKGINTGELYTWSGRYKQLHRNYGLCMPVYYFGCWSITGIGLFGMLHVSGIDAMEWIDAVDLYMNWDMASRIDPSLGQIGLTMALNELIEPIRFPFVLFTVKPVVNRLHPPKY